MVRIVSPWVGRHANFTNFTRLENLQTRLSIRSSFVKPSKERERGRDTIRFPCSDASIKYSIQQVTIVAKQRERNCWMPFLVAQYLTLKAVFDETVYVSDSEVIELSLSPFQAYTHSQLLLLLLLRRISPTVLLSLSFLV